MICFFVGEGVTSSKAEATKHFTNLQATLSHLGLTAAEHKARWSSQDIVWLGFRYSTQEMTITIPQEKLAEITSIVAD